MKRAKEEPGPSLDPGLAACGFKPPLPRSVRPRIVAHDTHSPA